MKVEKSFDGLVLFQKEKNERDWSHKQGASHGRPFHLSPSKSGKDRLCKGKVWPSSS
jgi:hypothetical protein